MPPWLIAFLVILFIVVVGFGTYGVLNGWFIQHPKPPEPHLTAPSR